MNGNYTDKYSFHGEWYDDTASLARKFIIHYFPTDSTVEMFDLKNRKTFVRRTKITGISLSNFFIGGSVTIFGRILKILDFACEDTKRKLEKSCQRTFGLIKPADTKVIGQIITDIYERGFRINNLKKSKLTVEDVNVIYKEERLLPQYPFVAEYMTGAYVYGMELVGDNAVEAWVQAVGHYDPAVAAPGTIRRRFGTDSIRNAVHGSNKPDRAAEDLEYFFPPPIQRPFRLGLTATLSNCTCCVVKPHAVREGLLGAIVTAIAEEDFEIMACNMYIVEHVNADEFYEVYKGIVPEYKGMVDELASGPCVAMEIVSKKPGMKTAVEFRKYVGPSDPEIARLLRPHTLRAKFGKTKIQNAVHCSDLPEDGLLEVEYFFKILYL